MTATFTEKNDMSKKLEAFRTRHVQEIKAYKEKQQEENSSKSTQQEKPTMPNLIGKRIRYLRKSYHLTQDEFADLAHVSRNTIIRCEHDGVAPTMENLEKMVLHLCSKMMGGDLNTMRNAFRPGAEKQAKVNVTLAKIVEVEGISVTEDEIAAEYEELAKQYELETEKVKNMIPVEEIKTSLETRKAIKVIVDSAVAVAPKKEEAAVEE